MQNLYYFFLILTSVYIVIRSKAQTRFLYIYIIILAVIFSFNTNNNDYEAYLKFYNSVEPGIMSYINTNANSSPLFTTAIMVCKIIGLDFNEFRLLLFLCILILFRIILKDEIHYGFFFCSYSLVYFFFDLVQLRFFAAYFILICALVLLAEKKVVWSIILIVVASLFHSICIVFLPLVFLHADENIQLKLAKRIPLILALIVVLGFFGNSVIALLQNVISRLSFFSEYSRYMVRTVKHGYLVYAALQILNFGFARLLNEQIYIRKIDKDSFCYKILSLNYFLQTIGFIFIFLIMININFSRFIRIIYVFNLLSYSANVCHIKKYKSKDNAIFNYSFDINQVKCFFAFMVLNGSFLFVEQIINGSLSIIKAYVFSSL